MNGFGAGASGQFGQYAPGFDGLNADVGATGLGVYGHNHGLTGLRGAQDPSLGTLDQSSMQDLGIPATPSRVVHRDMYGKAPEDMRSSPFGIPPLNANDVPYSPSVQSASQVQSMPYSSSQDNRSLPSHTHTPILERPSVAPVASFGSNQHLHGAFVSSPVHSAALSQWPPQPSPVTRRPGPFDPDYPTTSNTVITGMTTMSPMPYARSVQNIPSNDQSPWGPAVQQNRPVNGWGASSLTTENLGQHNQQQQEAPNQTTHASVDVAHGVTATAAAPAPVKTTVVEPAASAVPPSPAEPPRSQKTRPKSTTTQTIAPSPTVPKAAAAPLAPIKPPSPLPAPAAAPAVESKAPWAKEDETKKAKPSGAPLGLREIQEAEMKKLEARKAAERERERAARNATGGTSQSEDFQPFTTSWGLPTSQAGVARSAATPKESAASTVPSATTPATPVWTNAAKPVSKKTMKEIQEEEEKRKKLALKEKETVAAAAKRAYADTTTKPTAPAVQTMGGAWTTVGSGGKMAAVATPVAVRPTVTTTASAKVVPGASSPAVASASAVRATATPAAAPSPRPATATKASSKVDEFPTPPSQEFMKWIAESLKGLNNSVNFEEITSMLLTIPLDPDPDTVELISDLIYVNSTTMDGRRFASEFVSRRKVDAASRAKNGTPAGSSGKGVSIADVVKAQPKPTQQSEWGGFKVVNKKKKGGRA
ncbi:hypothetical protein EVJ58_g7 [Rhodofomes roseus]|uniref:Uncharacterized protein n=1 Tax=Rhodofomes roseus TaxID=34475 RepID=A0A4Y9Z6B3_9APHY|nr:hypothetical protein EVJ58_g7 [Rhodofomes roseus]